MKKKRRAKTLQIFEFEVPAGRPRQRGAGSVGLLPALGGEEARRSGWGWIECDYCRGQGWLTRPEWLLAWLHPSYPDTGPIERTLSGALSGRLGELSVREVCGWCTGSGRRYDVRGAGGEGAR